MGKVQFCTVTLWYYVIRCKVMSAASRFTILASVCNLHAAASKASPAWSAAPR
jgi:hypothetical protein